MDLRTSNLEELCGAMFDILKKPKYAVKNISIALNNMGSCKMSHETDNKYKVLTSNIPQGVRENFELMDMLLSSLVIQLSFSASCSILYL